MVLYSIGLVFLHVHHHTVCGRHIVLFGGGEECLVNIILWEDQMAGCVRTPVANDNNSSAGLSE